MTDKFFTDKEGEIMKLREIWKKVRECMITE